MPDTFDLVDDFATRVLRFTATADDLAPGHTDYDFPMRPSELLLAYTRRAGTPWVLDYVDVAGCRPRADNTVNPASRAVQRFHVTFEPFTVTTEFGVHAPPWLRGFVWRRRDPDAVDQSDGEQTA
ncbi:hypothetical protein [Streptomyces sp. MMBL 11-1]|uniref:hypothetical protein n=1 Tax=Streptomyces sp. MMBL 11-1 TaxID=3026420 RepID=UPI002362BEB7|nr:hypothetical protein [Streptomyces sp. MMBL 11-1]